MSGRDTLTAIGVVVLIAGAVAWAILGTHALGLVMPEHDETDHPVSAHALAMLGGWR